MPGRARRYRLTACLGCLTVGVAGCALTGTSVSARTMTAESSLVLTERVGPTALTIIVPGAGDAGVASAAVADTARPAESLVIMDSVRGGRVLVTTMSPSPATVTVPGKPVPPPAGASSYQWAVYRQQLRRWQATVAAGRSRVTRATEAEVSTWLRGLQISQLLTGLRAPQAGDGTLGAEGDAVGDLAPGSTHQAKAGGRRVVVLFVTSLTGTLLDGEVNGDHVVVVTRYLPTVEAASAAQIRLLRAGAASAVILGPETPTSEISQQIKAGQTLTARTEAFPGTALFAGAGAHLLPGAGHALQPLLALLRYPGATAVVNGYASAQGGGYHSYLLSYQRAAAVAGLLESSGIPSSAITVVGHGAAGGPSGSHSIVVVVATP